MLPELFTSSSRKLPRFVWPLALLMLAALWPCSPGMANGLQSNTGRGPTTLPPSATIDALAERTLRLFNVPGLALAIVQDGHTVFARGYGLRDRERNAPVDPQTVFGIGSITKSFTAAALALLVDQGAIKWDDRVIDHLPELQLSDPYVTRELTIRDLLSHRSGLGEGAGDLMLFSRSQFTREDAVHNLRFLPMSTSLRSHFAYNNMMFVVAGLLIERVSGERWERFVQERLLDPIGMSGCHADPVAALAHPVQNADIAVGYHEIGTTLMKLPSDPLKAAAPAGGILCNADGMARWMRLQLGGGSIDGRQILSRAQRDAMWTPQTILPPGPTAALSRQHFRSYGLGWFLEDFKGDERVWHSGTVAGMVTLISLLPERGTGFVVLTNQEDSNATNGLVAALTETVQGGTFDWLGEYKRREQATGAARDRHAVDLPGSTARPFLHPPATELAEYSGNYRDSWRGLFAISLQDGHLRLRVSRADDLAGSMEALPHDLFVVHWDDRAFNGSDDAYIQFHRDPNGQIVSATMRLIGSDFSFDVQDLDLLRQPA